MTLTASVPALTSVLPAAPAAPRALDIALLGLGQVGSAVAALAQQPPDSFGLTLRILGALVRDAARPRPDALHRRIRLNEDAARLFSPRPDVIVEVLGGIEPARTIILKALERGIPVVTANKSLLAAHGDELLAAAAATGAPLRYEAAVLAGVPFLGTFGTRPLAARISRVTGIVNGTTNYILTKMDRERQEFAAALEDAQRLGFAEPDPANDVDGVDAVEKLTVLIRHFARHSVRPGAIETVGIRGVQPLDLTHAREFGGALKFIVDAEWASGEVKAFAGPAFVPSAHKLARIDGVENAVSLRTATGELFYSGPGAGPAVTAATILDDVAECFGQATLLRTAPAAAPLPGPSATPVQPEAPAGGWFIRFAGEGSLPYGAEIVDLLGSFGVQTRRVSSVDTTTGRPVLYALTWPATRGRVERAVAAVATAARCTASCIRSLEA